MEGDAEEFFKVFHHTAGDSFSSATDIVDKGIAPIYAEYIKNVSIPSVFGPDTNQFNVEWGKDIEVLRLASAYEDNPLQVYTAPKATEFITKAVDITLKNVPDFFNKGELTKIMKSDQYKKECMQVLYTKPDLYDAPVTSWKDKPITNGINICSWINKANPNPESAWLCSIWEAIKDNGWITKKN